MPVYLQYLLDRYASRGGSVEYATVPSLASVDAPVVVNCTGIGARSLVPDESVVPVRGQVVVVENPGISEFYIDHGAEGTSDYVYAFPHGDVVILGGTAEEGASDWAPRPEVSARIMRDCAAAFPALAGARVMTERVGLRPVPARGAAGGRGAAGRAGAVAQLRARRRGRDPVLGVRPRGDRGGARGRDVGVADPGSPVQGGRRL